ncbi:MULTISPECIES: hypothetical protein [Methylobacterium]|uniref:Uncharacterized protein n=2 Tax=Methylobacterium TaxID=407 RepID=A0A8H8X0J7_9HYPH|nr:hypothetical protein [Methylobacterium indicum]BCM87824.1 hypothetical protein mvi_62850 [Methylobacterium indicum]
MSDGPLLEVTYFGPPYKAWVRVSRPLTRREVARRAEAMWRSGHYLRTYTIPRTKPATPAVVVQLRR